MWLLLWYQNLTTSGSHHFLQCLSSSIPFAGCCSVPIRKFIHEGEARPPVLSVGEVKAGGQRAQLRGCWEDSQNCKHELDMVTHTCKTSAQGAEAGGVTGLLQVQPSLHSKFQRSSLQNNCLSGTQLPVQRGHGHVTQNRQPSIHQWRMETQPTQTNTQSNMDELGGNTNKWNNPIMKGQMPYDSMRDAGTVHHRGRK